MLPVKQDVVDLIDPRVESFDFAKKMCNYIARQTTESCNGGKVKREEV